MKTKLNLLFLFIAIATTCYCQPSVSWEKWSFLIGEWNGESNGQPGQGKGTFTFSFDLDQNILVRKSHTEFPEINGRPAFSHNDLMIVYPESGGVSSKAIYFDNEGHIINYTVSYSGNSVVLTSEKKGNIPVFRLTYTLLDSETVNTNFEISRDGEKFITHTGGKSKKQK